MLIRPYEEPDEAAVVELWQRCELLTPANDPYRDIALKLLVQRELFLVGTLEDRLVATVMAGYEGHRGWVNYLAVSPEVQRRGLGRRMMDAVEVRLRAHGAPKLNLMVRGTNRAAVEFYRRLGFEVEDRIVLGKRLT